MEKEITSVVISFKPSFHVYLTYHLFSFYLIFSFLCCVYSHLTGPNQRMHVWDLKRVTSTILTFFSTSACLFSVSVSTTRWIQSQIPSQKAGRGCMAIIFSSLHVIIRSALCVDVYNKLIRETPQEVFATLGVVQ